MLCGFRGVQVLPRRICLLRIYMYLEKWGHILVLTFHKVNHNNISSQTRRTIMRQGFFSCSSSPLRVALSYSVKGYVSHQKITLKWYPKHSAALFCVATLLFMQFGHFPHPTLPTPNTHMHKSAFNISASF